MAYENILYDKKDGIAYITFNRPKVLNALNRKTVEELHHALLDAHEDASVRVLILTGAGEKSFVAGADIGELAQQTPVNGKEFSLYGQSVFHLLETMGKPSICAINGFALGGGSDGQENHGQRAAGRKVRHGSDRARRGNAARRRAFSRGDAFWTGVRDGRHARRHESVSGEETTAVQRAVRSK